jgi:hypothetical protein
VQHLVTFPTKGNQLGFQLLSECAAPSYVVNIEILISAGDLPPCQTSLHITRESHKELPAGCADGRLENLGRS